MIYALRTHYLQQQPWKAKNHYLRVAGTRPCAVSKHSPGQPVLGLVLAPLKVCGAGK